MAILQQIPIKLAVDDAPHRLLLNLVGEWTGEAKTWLDPAAAPDSSPWRARIRAALDGRFVVQEYEGTLNGEPLCGMVVWGHNNSAGRFTAAWVDTFHMGTGTMYCEGEALADGGFWVLGHYPDGEGGTWGWRTEVRLLGDQLGIKMFNISPGGQEDPAVETIFRRA